MLWTKTLVYVDRSEGRGKVQWPLPKGQVSGHKGEKMKTQFSELRILPRISPGNQHGKIK